MTAYGCNTHHVVDPMQFKFENKLTDLGLSYRVHHLGFYNISSQKGGANPITVRLINSLSINNRVYGSKNGNEVRGIGIFKFKFVSSEHDPDILTFTFQNTVKNKVEFLIIPTQEFLRRHAKMNTKSVSNKSIVAVFWIMEDECVYETTDMSVEAEWYFMSRGVNGRLADRTAIDYSEYLNNWQRLIV